MDAYRDEAARRKGVVCEKHGLAFDPEVHQGCVVCRRDASPPARTSPRAVLGVLAATVVVSAGSLFGYRAWLRAMRAPVGALCEARFGCVDGADCMSAGVVPGSRGRCYRTCTGDGACGEEERCHDGHCMLVAQQGERCGDGVACEDGAECVRLVGRGPQCLTRCSTLDERSPPCPQGTQCQSVRSSLMPLEPMLAQDYCLPGP